VAVSTAWDPQRYDEIVAGLPERIGELTNAPVTHVVSQPRKPQIEIKIEILPSHEKTTIGPLSVLGWGRHHDNHAKPHRTRSLRDRWPTHNHR
jgi:hypothetical protein